MLSIKNTESSGCVNGDRFVDITIGRAAFDGSSKSLSYDRAIDADKFDFSGVAAKYDTFSDSSSESSSETSRKISGTISKQNKLSDSNKLSCSELQEKNRLLVETLREERKKCEQLEYALEALEPVPGLDPKQFIRVIQQGEVVDQDIRDAKIVQLLKKNKHLSVQLQSEKSRGSKAQKEIARLTEELALKNEQICENGADQSNESQDAKPDIIVQLQHDCRMLRQRAQESHAELKNVKRILKLELGQEDGIVEKAMNSTVSSWKGRAQQIEILKQKIEKMQHKNRQNSLLKASEDKRGIQMDSTDSTRSDSKQVSIQQKNRINFELEHRISISEEKIELLIKQNARHKARITLLESENSRLRKSVTTILEKTTSDDELIKSLQDQLQLQRNIAVKRLQSGPTAESKTHNMSRVQNEILPDDSADDATSCSSGVLNINGNISRRLAGYISELKKEE